MTNPHPTPTGPETAPLAARRADTLGAHLLAFVAGMASGLAFAQLLNGGMLGLLLGYAAPLPLFLAGFAGGRGAAVTATLCGILAVALRLGDLGSAAYALLFAVPAMVLVRVALIRRYTVSGGSSFVSGGTVLLTALGLGTLLMIAAASWLTLSGPGMSAVVTQLTASYQALIAQNAPDVPADQIARTLGLLNTMIPSLLLLSWFFILLITGIVAQWTAVEMGYALRPALRLKGLVLPRWLVGLFALCVVGAAVADANTALTLAALATLYAIGFILAGLGEMHRRLDLRLALLGWTAFQRKLLYIFIYGVVFLLPFAILFPLLLGLIAPFTAPQFHHPNGHAGDTA